MRYAVIHGALTDDKKDNIQSEQTKESVDTLLEKFRLSKPEATEGDEWAYVGAWIENHPIGCLALIKNGI